MLRLAAGASIPGLAGPLPARARFDFYGVPFEAAASSEGPALAHLRRVYSYFLREEEETAAAPAHRLLILEDGSPQRAAFLRAQGREDAASGDLLVVDWFDWALILESEALLRYYASKLLRLGVVAALEGEFVTLHGASLQADGGGLLLVGEAASGKTSLTLGLIERGFRYSADDTTCVRRRDLCCVPFPMPFVVRADLSTGRPPLPELASRRPDIEVLDEPRWLVERWPFVASEFHPTCLVFLGPEGGAPGEAREIAPSESVLEVLRNVIFPLGADLGRFDPFGADFGFAADLVAGAKCLRLNTQDLGKAFDTVLGLLADSG